MFEEAAFTGQLEDEFSHSNIIGTHVSEYRSIKVISIKGLRNNDSQWEDSSSYST